MRVLVLIPGGMATQLQAIPAVAAVAAKLQAQVQVACPAGVGAAWKLVPAVEKVLGYSFDGGVSLADWANLLGGVREPDFQVCLNLGSGWPIDLMLSLGHIPTRIATGGFSATTTVSRQAGWPNQTLEAWLRPIGVPLDAASYRLSLPQASLEQAVAAAPAGEGPLLLLAPDPQPTAATADWPAQRWQELPQAIRARLPQLRVQQARRDGTPLERATQVAAADVVLSSDPVTTELAVLSGTPLVALGRSGDSLPSRPGVQGLGVATSLHELDVADVLQALGLG
ncbi:MAG: lipopolysaccharide heptosyltransferase family protein [Cyanobium sp. CZS 48M]|nr:lipopolysaccharide heptosyltransferase family protein [Cyanobium sp. CZS48M]